jgi:hypothetical protein
MLSSGVTAVQRIRAGGKSLPARTIRRLPRLQCQGPVSIRVRCLAVQPDAAPTDQLDDAGSHGVCCRGPTQMRRRPERGRSHAHKGRSRGALTVCLSLFRVKLRRTRCERADIGRYSLHVSNVPMAATAPFTAAENSCTLSELPEDASKSSCGDRAAMMPVAGKKSF